jgi:hypothetical protein
MSQHELLGVCEHEFNEAPVCWLHRAALSQGVSMRELCKWFDIPYGGDLDVNFARANFRQIALRCGFSETAFFQVQRTLRAIGSLCLSEVPLLRRNGRASYRFCPICLREQPFFPLHWRLSPYRMCYRHACLMEDACPTCGRRVTFERQGVEVVRASVIALASQCVACGQLLSKVEPIYLSDLSFRHLTWQEREQLDNGCAFASALAFDLTAGWFREGAMTEHQLLDMLPCDSIPSADAVRLRREKDRLRA